MHCNNIMNNNNDARLLDAIRTGDFTKALQYIHEGTAAGELSATLASSVQAAVQQTAAAHASSSSLSSTTCDNNNNTATTTTTHVAAVLQQQYGIPAAPTNALSASIPMSYSLPDIHAYQFSSSPDLALLIPSHLQPLYNSQQQQQPEQPASIIATSIPTTSIAPAIASPPTTATSALAAATTTTTSPTASPTAATKKKKNKTAKKTASSQQQKWPSKLLLMLIQEDGNIQDEDWEAVYQRIQSHPHEIRCSHSSHSHNNSHQKKHRAATMNALHAACMFYPPTRIVQAMMTADPEAALEPTTTPSVAGIAAPSHSTPLQLAIRYNASEEVQTVLLQACPAAASNQDRSTGDTALHCAVREGSTVGILEQLLMAYPTAIHTFNHRHRTPFDLLPRSYLEANGLHEIIGTNNHNNNNNNNTNDDDDYDEPEGMEDYRDDWDLLVLFLQYSYFGTKNDNEINNYERWMVHAAAACVSCPREVLQFLCRLFPHQSVAKYHSNNTPLLLACQQVAATAPSDSEINTDATTEWDDVEDGYRQHVEVSQGLLRHPLQQSSSKDLPPHFQVQHGDTDFVQTVIVQKVNNDNNNNNNNNNESPIHTLLQWNPLSASIVDSNGRFPLAHAIQSGQSFHTIKPLIAACPRVLEGQDALSGFYPFHLAAQHALLDLDTVYLTARAVPHLLKVNLTTTTTNRRKREADSTSTTNSDVEVEPLTKKARAM